jgi:hydrogenase nickel incorporation protein HypA/HybF
VVGRIGPLAGVAPDQLRLAFPPVAAGTSCEGAMIEIEVTAVEIVCRICGGASHVRANRLLCVACGGQGMADWIDWLVDPRARRG